jgi:hypothetical protein
MGISIKLLPLCIIVLFTITAFPEEQEITVDQIPNAVLESFSKSFPEAITQSFTAVIRNDQTCYEIQSTEEHISSELLYDTNGTLVESVEKIPYDSLPAPVKSYLKSTYKEILFMISERTFKNNQTTYSVLLDNNNSIEKKFFNSDGNLAKDAD